MTRIFTEKDCKSGALSGRKIAVFGYGSQGRAQALNLRDSGEEVLVSLPAASRSRERAEADGFSPVPAAKAAAAAGIISMLAPDEKHREIFEEQIEMQALRGKAVVFAHGFNVVYGVVRLPPETDVVLVAPKGPGCSVRSDFESGIGTPALVAVHNDASGSALEVALGYAAGIGAAKAGLVETSFREETETDLFGEQAVLCGGVSELVRAAFETLVDHGYSAEAAWFECLYELKLTVDLIHRGGISHMRRNISTTALYGDLTRGGRIIDGEVRRNMTRVLDDIRSGRFASEWLEEAAAGKPVVRKRLEDAAGSSIEKTDAEMRSMIPRLSGGK